MHWFDPRRDFERRAHEEIELTDKSDYIQDHRVISLVPRFRLMSRMSVFNYGYEFDDNL